MIKHSYFEFVLVRMLNDNKTIKRNSRRDTYVGIVSTHPLTSIEHLHNCKIHNCKIQVVGVVGASKPYHHQSDGNNWSHSKSRSNVM